jgi:hypothetical protein
LPDDFEKPELRHVPFGDARRAADIGWDGGRSDFVALADGADTEWRLIFQAALGHIHVALLEDAERQPASGKEDGVKREKRQFYDVPSCASPR